MRVRRFLFLFVVLQISLLCHAQFTTVSGTVTDPNGLAYAYGTLTPQLIYSGGTPTLPSGSPYFPPTAATGLDVNGHFIVTLADTSLLTPGGSKWNFLVCSGAGTVNPAFGKGPVCFSLASPITISGSSQNITTNLNAVAVALTANFSSGGTPGGSSGQIQFNNSGTFGGISNQLAGYTLASQGSTAITTPAFQLKPSVDSRDYGTFGDGSSHTISSGDIASNTQWLGCGTVNTSGTSVTWVSGAKFYRVLASYNIPISIAGTTYSVSSTGSLTNGVTTTMTLGSSAGTQTGARWCIYSSGDQWDYVGLQEAVFTALGAPGSENGFSNSFLNRELIIPSGSFQLNKALIFSRTVGAHIRAAQRFGVILTQLSNNMPLFLSNGFAYSKVEGIQWRSSGSATATGIGLLEVDWDGGTGGLALQENTWQDNYINAGSTGTWQLGFNLAPSGNQGDTELYLNNFFSGFSLACYEQATSFNALDNTFIGGNFQSCTLDGMRIAAGNIEVFGTAFQDGTPVSSPAQTGCDIDIRGSANDTDVFQGGIRTESGCFIKSSAGALISVYGAHQQPGTMTWTPSTACSSFNNNLVIPPFTTTQFIGGAFKTTSASGNTGASEPTWTYTTTTDGACTWTYVPLTFVDANNAVTIRDSSAQYGSVILENAPKPFPAVIENNIFSHADWLNPNTTNPFASSTSFITLSNNLVSPSGGYNSGAGTTQAWGIANSTKFYQGTTFHDEGNQPHIWSTGASGTLSEADVGIGPGRNPSNTSLIYPEAILAVVSPAAVNVKLGRPDPFGTDQTGADQDIAGGRSTGAGASGNVNFWTNPASGSSGTLNSLVKQWQITPAGALTALAANPITAGLFKSSTRCAAVGTAANPSVVSCSAAPAGAFSCATNASAGTCTLNTTAIGANSTIIVQETAAAGTTLGVTCNTAPTVLPAIIVASQSTGTSTLNMPTYTTNPACFYFWVVNQ